MNDTKELKRELRQLKKLKKECRAGTKERLDLHRQIVILKKKLEELVIIEPLKIEDTKEYRNVYYTGYISPATKETLKFKFGIQFVEKYSLTEKREND